MGGDQTAGVTWVALRGLARLPGGGKRLRLSSGGRVASAAGAEQTCGAGAPMLLHAHEKAGQQPARGAARVGWGHRRTWSGGRAGRLTERVGGSACGLGAQRASPVGGGGSSWNPAAHPFLSGGLPPCPLSSLPLRAPAAPRPSSPLLWLLHLSPTAIPTSPSPPPSPLEQPARLPSACR